jgi:hypothetical protein
VLVCRVGALVAAATALAAAPAAAQLTASTSAASSYMWRGLVVREGIVITPAVEAVTVRGPWFVVAGADAAVQPFIASASEPAPLDGSVWIDAGASVRRLSMGLGLLAMLTTEEQVGTVVELAATASLAAPLSPALAVYRELTAAGAAYAELSFAVDGSGIGAPVSLSASAGAALRTHDAYASRGLTHIEAAVSTTWQRAAWSVTPEVRTRLGIDERTLPQRVRGWLVISLSREIASH